MQSILIIDDDNELCVLLKDYLTSEGFAVETALTGNEGLDQAVSGQWGLILLDVMLPDLNGFDLLAQLRLRSQVPVLMLTARQEEIDRIVGLEMGADDYQVKPFHARELLARIRAVLRRSDPAFRQNSDAPRRISLGDVLIDTGTRAVLRSGTDLCLTQVEFAILLLLADSLGQMVDREKISHTALGRELIPFDRSIDVHLSNLRRKLGPYPDGSRRILTIRGSGYLYVPPEGHDGALTGNNEDTPGKEN